MKHRSGVSLSVPCLPVSYFLNANVVIMACASSDSEGTALNVTGVHSGPSVCGPVHTVVHQPSSAELLYARLVTTKVNHW